MVDKNNAIVGFTGSLVKLDPEDQVVTSSTQTLTGVDYGYISEDGVEITNDKSTTDKKVWQENEVIRTLTDEASITFAMTLVETTDATSELYYGSAPDEDGVVVWSPSNSVRGRFALTVIDPSRAGGQDVAIRYVFDGQVSATEAITVSATEFVQYGVTIKVLGSVQVFNPSGGSEG